MNSMAVKIQHPKGIANYDWKLMAAKLSAFGISEFPFNYGDVLVSILVFSAIIDLHLVVQNILEIHKHVEGLLGEGTYCTY